MPTKLNVLLAKTDHLSKPYKAGLVDYVKFFKGSQGAFLGEKKTYEERPGMLPDPTMKGTTLVVTTVDEKLGWLSEASRDYIDSLFSQERTNATGLAKARLVVDGVDFGEYTSLELLRLKSILEDNNLKEMYENLPVRKEDEMWVPTKDEAYKNRNIYESPRLEGVKKTTTKESYILPDPNVDKTSVAYKPQIATKDTVVEVGQYTQQRFSGATSHQKRADILRRRSKMITAVVEALKIANEVDAVPSEMTSDKLFKYLHTGTL